jgi:hypothetical protein
MRDRPRVPGILATLVAAVLAVAAHGPVLAGGVTAEQLIGIAESQYAMTCVRIDPTLERCQTSPTSPDRWTAEIRPASGLVTALTTIANQFVAPLDQRAVSMMDGLHVPTCTDRVGVEGFVARVAAMSSTGSFGPQVVGPCSMLGDLQAAPRTYTYTVTASVLAPPTPSPSPTRAPTSGPTSSSAPASTPSLAASGTTGVVLTPSPSATPSVSPSPTGSATPSPSAATSAATGAASPSPEGGVAAAVGSPAPPSRHTTIPGLGFAASVAEPAVVRFDPAALGASALLALLLLLLMAFPGELFNSTVESNYDEIAGWLRWLRLQTLGGLWRGPAGVVMLLALGALVYSMLDPGFGLDIPSLASYLGLLGGLIVVLVAFELPGLLMHRRRTGELGALQALPWTLAAGGICVLVSRLANFEPGYLYGVLLGVVFSRPQNSEDDGRQAAAGALLTLIAAVGAWLALGWLRVHLTDGSFLRVATETALAAIVVAGLEAVAFGMMPFRFLDGAAVRAWSRVVWGLLFVAGVFAFVHLLIGPQSGYLAELSPAGFAAALAVFAAFAAVSFGLWGYFRFRPSRGDVTG